MVGMINCGALGRGERKLTDEYVQGLVGSNRPAL